MFMDNTGVFQLRDCGYHARWLKIFPLFRNFSAKLFTFRISRPLGTACIWHSVHRHLSGERLLKCLGLSPVALSTGVVFDILVIKQCGLIPVTEPLGAHPARQLPRQRQ